MNAAAEVGELQRHATLDTRRAILDDWHMAHFAAVLRGGDPEQAVMAADLSTLARHGRPCKIASSVHTTKGACELCGSRLAVEQRWVARQFQNACVACFETDDVLCAECKLPFKRRDLRQQHSYTDGGWVHVCAGCRPRHSLGVGAHDAFCGGCKTWSKLVVSELTTCCGSCGQIWLNDPTGVMADTVHEAACDRTLPELVVRTAQLDPAARATLDRADALRLERAA